jgi:hypothetical protein
LLQFQVIIIVNMQFVFFFAESGIQRVRHLTKYTYVIEKDKNEVKVVLRFRDVYSGFRIQIFPIPEPGSASNNLTPQKKASQLSEI